MRTTILEPELEFSWWEGAKNHLDNNDTEHIEEEIKKGNKEGELCQSVGAEGEIFGWWEIKNHEDDALKYMQKAERLENVVDEIDGLLDQIDTLTMNTRSDKELSIGRELIDQNMEGIDNVVAIIKTKIEEAKDKEIPPFRYGKDREEQNMINGILNKKNSVDK